VLRVQLRSRVDGVEKRKGREATPDDIAVLLKQDCNVYQPNGKPLLFLRKRVYNQALLDEVRPILAHVAKKYRSDNRAAYAGAKRAVAVFKDGTKSSNTRTVDENGKHLAVPSAVIGYFDKQGGRFPFCRATAFTANEVALWEKIIPLAQRTAEVFKRELPEQYSKQKLAADNTPSEFIIRGTPFTTMTVNHNVIGRIHQDKGDFPDGFGCLMVLRRGQYGGGILTYPEYRCGVDLEDGDMVLFSPHDWHGVTEFIDPQPDHERISVVFYFRSKMEGCLPSHEQLEQLKAKQAL